MLQDDVQSIDQVVVTGIFNKSRESYTGAVKTISASDLKASGNRSILSQISNIDPSLILRIILNLDRTRTSCRILPFAGVPVWMSMCAIFKRRVA